MADSVANEFLVIELFFRQAHINIFKMLAISEKRCKRAHFAVITIQVHTACFD
jgi:hypothetical protein